MRTFFCTFICFLLAWQSAFAAEPVVHPKFQMKAVWLTTVYGLDWPSKAAGSFQDEKRQQAELTRMLDDLKAQGFNTVFLQVRGRGDLIYPSSVEPINPWVAAKGYTLRYDPLAFAISECRKRGLSIHAWMVVLPLGDDKYVRRLSGNAFAKSHRAQCVKFKGDWYMDPTHPSTLNHLDALITDLVKRYEVDGVHLDYIRYPDRTDSYPDAYKYKTMRAKGESLAEWREGNINRLVAGISKVIKRERPEVMLSAAVLAAYRELPGKPQLGWTAKKDVYQDPVAWAKSGDIDFIVPMMYYRGERFTPFVQDWCELMEVPVVMGLGAYRVDPREGRWPYQEVIEQTKQVLTQPKLAGVCYFRAAHVLGHRYQLGRQLKGLDAFKYISLPFNRTLKGDSIQEGGMHDFTITHNEEGLVLSWNADNSSCSKLFAVYTKSQGEMPDVQSTADLVTITQDERVVIPWEKIQYDDLTTIAIEGYDMYGATLLDEVYTTVYYRMGEPK